jgi:hypothetical protein
MRKPLAFVLIGCAMVAGSLIGCSSKPSADELQQLSDLKAEVTSLDNGIKARESEKAALIKSMADKDAQLAQCAKDKVELEKRLKSVK